MKPYQYFTRGAMALALTLAGAASTTFAATTLKFASEENFGTPPRVAAQYGLEHLRDSIGKATNNAFDIKIYPNATLGSEKELIKSVANGTVDATVMSPGNIAGLLPEAQLFSTSYLFTSYDHAKKVLSNEQFLSRMKQIVRDRKMGFQLAAISLTGTRNLYNRVKPVNTVEGIAGMKMRVMNSPTEFKIWSTLGMLPSTIPGPEIYSSLQSGVVDAAESSLPAIVGGKYYEVAPHITLTHHQYNLHFYMVGDKAIAKIPAAVQGAVFKAFEDAAKVQLDAAVRLADEKLQFLRSSPKVTVSEVDARAFARKLIPIQDEVAATLKMQDVLKLIRSLEN
jgi:tripartite ATP-independent transporter DctP family solute receptor